MASRMWPMSASIIRTSKTSMWNDFGAITMAFEGWKFRLDLLDPSDEA